MPTDHAVSGIEKPKEYDQQKADAIALKQSLAQRLNARTTLTIKLQAMVPAKAPHPQPSLQNLPNLQNLPHLPPTVLQTPLKQPSNPV
jgi:hypothetical protein